MHIILDSNVYASDYRMSGVSFRTLFDYLRRTESNIVLPKIIREEVVADYGRELEEKARKFAKAHDHFHRLDLGTHREAFREPDIKNRMNELRRLLREPPSGIKPVCINEIKGVSVLEAFMRGVLRTKPATESGEELRDVIIWLWTLGYARSSGEEVAFISNDGHFWETDGPHLQIVKDIKQSGARIAIHRSIDDFIKKHAPAPIPATEEWVRQYVSGELIERALLARGISELSRQAIGAIENVIVEKLVFVTGNIFKIDSDTQFAELQFKVFLKFDYQRNQIASVWTHYLDAARLMSTSRSGAFYGDFGKSVLGNFPNTYNLFMGPAETTTNPIDAPAPDVKKEIHTEAAVQVSVRIKSKVPTELSISSFDVERWDK